MSRRTGRERRERKADRKEEKREERFWEIFGIYADPIGYFQPSNPGPHSTWVVCGRCSLRYEMATGMYLMWANISQEVTFRAGPCPSCFFEDGVTAWGDPELTMAESDSWTVAGATEEIAITTLMWMVDGLREGTLDVPTVAKDLRTRGGPFRRIGEWLEERPVTASLAIGVLSAIAAIAGPQLADDSGSGVDEKEIVEIIDTVLDHYDQQLDRGQTSPPPAPAPQPKGAAQRRSEPRPDRSEPNN